MDAVCMPVCAGSQQYKVMYEWKQSDVEWRTCSMISLLTCTQEQCTYITNLLTYTLSMSFYGIVYSMAPRFAIVLLAYMYHVSRVAH